VVLHLAKKLTAGVGDKVIITTDDGDLLTAYIAADNAAPKYTFMWASGATNAPSAVTELDGVTTTSVTVG